MFNITQFREEILVPALSQLQLYSKDAEELLVFTCAAESNGGTYIRQIKGPALGIFQCEPATHEDLWRNFILRKNQYVSILSLNFNIARIPEPSTLIYDLKYAAAICRLHYFRFKEPLPNKDDIDAIWEYYKKYYNTEKGKATKSKSISAYKSFIQNT